MTSKGKLNLIISDELWNEFKYCVSRRHTLNDMVVYLIQKYIDDVRAGRELDLRYIKEVKAEEDYVE